VAPAWDWSDIEACARITGRWDRTDDSHTYFDLKKSM
jgi:hypothetical protein